MRQSHRTTQTNTECLTLVFIRVSSHLIQGLPVLFCVLLWPIFLWPVFLRLNSLCSSVDYASGCDRPSSDRPAPADHPTGSRASRRHHHGILRSAEGGASPR